MTMLTEKFDAYGDVLPEVACDEREAVKTTSEVLSRIGHRYRFRPGRPLSGKSGF